MKTAIRRPTIMAALAASMCVSLALSTTARAEYGGGYTYAPAFGTCGAGNFITSIQPGSVQCGPATFIGALTPGSVIFAASDGSLTQDNANFFWDATNHRLGIGTAAPSVTLHVAGPGGINEYKINPTAGIQSPTGALFVFGSAASPVTSFAGPSMQIFRREAINDQNTTGGANAALFVGAIGSNTSVVNTAQTNALVVDAQQLSTGSGDSAGLFATSTNFGTGNHTAFGAFVQAQAVGATTNANGIELSVANNTGTNSAAYDGTLGAIRFSGLEIDYSASGGKLGSVGMFIRSDSGQFDVGVGFMNNATKTADIRTDDSALTVFKINGSHTDGIDATGGTFSGNPFKSTGFSVNPAGMVSASSLAVVGNAAFGAVISFSAQANVGVGPGLSYSTGNAFLFAGGTAGFVFNNNAGTTNIMTLSNTGALASLLSMAAGTYLQTGALAVASLPTCNAGTKAARYFVTDANAAFTAGIGATVAAGGANNVPVTCDGSNWRIGANDNFRPLNTKVG